MRCLTLLPKVDKQSKGPEKLSQTGSSGSLPVSQTGNASAQSCLAITLISGPQLPQVPALTGMHFLLQSSSATLKAKSGFRCSGSKAVRGVPAGSAGSPAGEVQASPLLHWAIAPTDSHESSPLEQQWRCCQELE